MLCFFIVFLTYDLFLLLYYRVTPGPWLEVGGMLVAANGSEKMETVKGAAIDIQKRQAKISRYFV